MLLLTLAGPRATARRCAAVRPRAASARAHGALHDAGTALLPRFGQRSHARACAECAHVCAPPAHPRVFFFCRIAIELSQAEPPSPAFEFLPLPAPCCRGAAGGARACHSRVSTRILGKTMRDAVRSWEMRNTETGAVRLPKILVRGCGREVQSRRRPR